MEDDGEDWEDDTSKGSEAADKGLFCTGMNSFSSMNPGSIPAYLNAAYLNPAFSIINSSMNLWAIPKNIHKPPVYDIENPVGNAR